MNFVLGEPNLRSCWKPEFSIILAFLKFIDWFGWPVWLHLFQYDSIGSVLLHLFKIYPVGPYWLRLHRNDPIGPVWLHLFQIDPIVPVWLNLVQTDPVGPVWFHLHDKYSLIYLNLTLYILIHLFRAYLINKHHSFIQCWFFLFDTKKYRIVLKNIIVLMPPILDNPELRNAYSHNYIYIGWWLWIQKNNDIRLFRVCTILEHTFLFSNPL